ncbi:hypothetical protein [Acinetobacter modestus]|uniref:hypothetical protein n=1 Tax=Acinetobacter modestus TaxID=1776740 RepID=UPI001F4B93BF|nr:hypothetical protein [Acinetobacter modestus]MCH7333991.1 hypothetical protein [Acinetobacter modestus]
MKATIKIFKINFLLVLSLLMISGCSKETNRIQGEETPETSVTGSFFEELKPKLYDFPNISNDEFYDDLVVINDAETYRKLRFEDFETGKKVLGAGQIHIIQKQDDGREAAIVSTKSLVNYNAVLFELLGSKSKFDGNLAILVFDAKERARILVNDNIAFKGVVAPSDLYTYTNDSNKVESIPIIYVHYYKAGDLTMPDINKFLEKPKAIEPKLEPLKSVKQRQEPRDSSEQANVPQFRDYPSKEAYTGKPAKLLLNNDTAKLFRTRLREALTQEPEFAGEYVMAVWGCGTECRSYTFVNKRTGQVIEQSFGGEDGDEPEKFKLNSNLLVAHGTEYDNDYNEIGYHASFYVLENDKFKLIKKVPTEKPVEEE